MPKPIIVAVDPERDDDAPLRAGVALARITGSPLVVAGAYLHDDITNAVSHGAVDQDLHAHVLEVLEARTATLDAELIVDGGSSPAHVLHDAAVDLDALMVVVGSTHRGPVGRVAPGTTAERLLHGAPCPVAIVPADLDADWTPSSIGVAFIDTEEGHGALRAAVSLSRAAGAEIRAVTAVEPHMPSSRIAPYGAGGPAESARIARNGLHAAIAQLPAGTAITGEIVRAHADDALSELTTQVDLLVCGSRGYGPLRAVLAGSVTHAVIRKAQCPVLVVPRGAENALGDLTRRSEAAAG
jgi:nucleotide-binding universal stress UspA family protein